MKKKQKCYHKNMKWLIAWENNKVKLSMEFLQSKYLLHSIPQRISKPKRINKPDHCLLPLPKNSTFQAN